MTDERFTIDLTPSEIQYIADIIPPESKEFPANIACKINDAARRWVSKQIDREIFSLEVIVNGEWTTRRAVRAKDIIIGDLVEGGVVTDEATWDEQNVIWQIEYDGANVDAVYPPGCLVLLDGSLNGSLDSLDEHHETPTAK
jgi:hypothetical protein